MINKNKIVPVTKTDLLSLYGTVIALNNKGDLTVLEAEDGNFVVSENPDDAALCNRPVKTLEFGDDVTEAEVYFVAAYDFVGITPAPSGTVPEIKADANSLYKAELADSAITVTAITPQI